MAETTSGRAPASAELIAMIERAYAESAFRGKILYFPERVVAEYGLEPSEAYAVRTGDLTRVELPEALRDKATYVWDTTHMSSGE